jgi:MFS family permease
MVRHLALPALTGVVAVPMAALMVFPQVVTVLLAPWLGRQAERFGRKPLLLVGFAILPVRVMLLSTTTDPGMRTLIQLLDGIGAVVMGMATPLAIADLAGGSGRYNLAQGVYGTVIGLGVAGSRLLAGAIAIALFMPETKPGGVSAPTPARATAAE